MLRFCKTLTLAFTLITSSLMSVTLAQLLLGEAMAAVVQEGRNTDSNTLVAQNTAEFFQYYSGCDVIGLSDYWGQSRMAAKQKAVRLINQGNMEAVYFALRMIADNPGDYQGWHQCVIDRFYGAGYSWNDAQALANCWESSIGYAKGKLVRMLYTRDQFAVSRSLRNCTGRDQ